MTHRTDHPSLITPELAALAELVCLVEVAIFAEAPAYLGSLAELLEAHQRAKQLVAERLALRVGLQREPGPDTSFAQLQMALAEHRAEQRA